MVVLGSQLFPVVDFDLHRSNYCHRIGYAARRNKKQINESEDRGIFLYVYIVFFVNWT